jgi:hypothetical protein
MTYTHLSMKWPNSLDQGIKAEKAFQNSCELAGCEIKPASPKENMKGVDFFLSAEGAVDVKSMKKKKRSEPEAQADEIWLEIINNKGEEGWIYKEDHWTAFELDDYFLLTLNAYLIILVCQVVDFSEMAKDARDALYKTYTRKNKNDLTTRVKPQDVMNYPHFLISKAKT